jgi:hypothetical protein
VGHADGLPGGGRAFGDFRDFAMAEEEPFCSSPAKAVSPELLERARRLAEQETEE